MFSSEVLASDVELVLELSMGTIAVEVDVDDDVLLG